MDFISYNIKKRFLFMPSIIQVTIFIFASAFMLVYNTLFIDIEVKTWINKWEELTFWFFLIFPFLCFILLIIRIFSYDLPSKRMFSFHKILFFIGQAIMFIMSFTTSIIFFQIDNAELGHGQRNDFYKNFIAAVFMTMAIMVAFASIPIMSFKSPSVKKNQTGGTHA